MNWIVAETAFLVHKSQCLNNTKKAHQIADGSCHHWVDGTAKNPILVVKTQIKGVNNQILTCDTLNIT